MFGIIPSTMTSNIALRSFVLHARRAGILVRLAGRVNTWPNSIPALRKTGAEPAAPPEGCKILTLPSRQIKSISKVARVASNTYASWRSLLPPSHALRDDTGLPEEKFLQQIWHHQRLLRDQLRALDGKPLQILHPGFWNREAGPDFSNAVIQLDGAPPITGDVEIDLHPRGWRSHGHGDNPSYGNVILQVVWEGDSENPGPFPIFALKPHLDAPIQELISWLNNEAGSILPASLKGQCYAPLKDLPPTLLSELLRQASEIRLHSKAAQFHARARQVGWDQTLREGLFAALGYKHNVWPMRRLGELSPELIPPAPNPEAAFPIQARLLGISGLLPNQLSDVHPSVRAYLRQVWDLWWRERGSFGILPRTLWRFHGIRPANHPQRRLALASHWLAEGDLHAKIEKWFTQIVTPREMAHSLLDLLQVPSDPFWSWHWTFRSKPLKSPQPLLGPQRLADLAMNVILPWLWMRAVTGQNEALRQTAEHRYFTWPPAEDNSILRLARKRLFGSTLKKPETAAAQQALLQIVRDFCNHSNALCERCPFPDLVASLK
jgi:hypothetical protein